MDYIVLDMEWNQPWPGSPSSAKRCCPVADPRGDHPDRRRPDARRSRPLQDEFQIMVKPRLLPATEPPGQQAHRYQGSPPARMRACRSPRQCEKFRDWCGDDAVFLTWGFDDIGILRENLRLFGLDERWTEKWYNAQMIFNAQTDGSTAQKALKTAHGDDRHRGDPSRPRRAGRRLSHGAASAPCWT